MLTTSVFMMLLLTLTQIIVGDIVGLKVLKHQPIKTAAMEANWKTQKGAPLVLFAIPNSKTETNDYSIEIPKLASFINTHKLDGELPGLDMAKPSDRPNITMVFFTFRVMVGIGFLLLAMSLSGLYLWFKKQLFSSTWYHRLLIYSTPLGFIAVTTGWITAEVGRQPWLVYGLFKTNQGLSPVLVSQVWISLITISTVYIIITTFFFYYTFKLIKGGIKNVSEEYSGAHSE